MRMEDILTPAELAEYNAYRDRIREKHFEALLSEQAECTDLDIRDQYDAELEGR